MNFNIIIVILTLGIITWLLGLENNKINVKILGAILVLIGVIINLLDILKVI